MSGTADWSDTNNKLNNAVKHIHWCVVITKTKKKVVEIINFKNPFYD